MTETSVPSASTEGRLVLLGLAAGALVGLAFGTAAYGGLLGYALASLLAERRITNHPGAWWSIRGRTDRRYCLGIAVLLPMLAYAVAIFGVITGNPLSAAAVLPLGWMTVRTAARRAHDLGHSAQSVIGILAVLLILRLAHFVTDLTVVKASFFYLLILATPAAARPGELS